MKELEVLRPRLDRARRRALVVGTAGIVLSLIGFFLDRAQFFHSYLVGYLFWLSLPIGSFAILMLHHLVGGGWGFVIRRLLEAGTRTIRLMLLLFVPIILGRHDLYEWTEAAAVARDEALQHKSAYLNTPFFLARAALYFAIWLVLAYFLSKWSTDQDRTHDPALTRRLQDLSGPGLVLWGATVTFAAVDWVMSLEPHWYSTVYGILFMVGQGLTALALMIVALARLADQPPLLGVVGRQQFHDLGNLMLAFLMLWAYISFSQFLIIWSGNLPEEITWYKARLAGGWQWLGVALILVHFALPFVLLLVRQIKRTYPILAMLAMAMLVTRWVDLFWIVTPAFHHQGPVQLHLHWMDFTTMAGIGGVWLAAFIWQVKRWPLLPLYDPRLEESLPGVRESFHHG